MRMTTCLCPKCSGVQEGFIPLSDDSNFDDDWSWFCSSHDYCHQTNVFFLHQNLFSPIYWFFSQRAQQSGRFFFDMFSVLAWSIPWCLPFWELEYVGHMLFWSRSSFILFVVVFLCMGNVSIVLQVLTPFWAVYYFSENLSCTLNMRSTVSMVDVKKYFPM